MRQELVKPLLMLHALELQDKNDNQIYSAVGFGISFPALEIKKFDSVKVKINNVYRKQLEEAYKDEVGEDIEYHE